MHVGYVKVSKREQNPDLQRRELEAAGGEMISSGWLKEASSHLRLVCGR